MMKHERCDRMIYVKDSEPRLLLTVAYGCESVVSYEVENVLFELIQDVKCIPFKNKGIILVTSSIDIEPLELVKLLRRKRIDRVIWAIPIHKHVLALSLIHI